MNFQEYRKEVLKNPKIKKEFERYDLAFEIGQLVIEARIKRGVTGAQLARRLGTRASIISRLENGRSLPSLKFLSRVSKALTTDFMLFIIH